MQDCGVCNISSLGILREERVYCVPAQLKIDRIARRFSRVSDVCSRRANSNIIFLVPVGVKPAIIEYLLR
jgi:hypothetical protein